MMTDGMVGYLSAEIPLNFVCPLSVVRVTLPVLSSSTVTSWSCMSAMYCVRNLAESVNRPSASMSIHSVMMYSIAMSRLFPVRTSFWYHASMSMFSRIGVRFEVLVA